MHAWPSRTDTPPRTQPLTASRRPSGASQYASVVTAQQRIHRHVSRIGGSLAGVLSSRAPTPSAPARVDWPGIPRDFLIVRPENVYFSQQCNRPTREVRVKSSPLTKKEDFRRCLTQYDSAGERHHDGDFAGLVSPHLSGSNGSKSRNAYFESTRSAGPAIMLRIDTGQLAPTSLLLVVSDSWSRIFWSIQEAIILPEIELPLM